MRTELGRLAEVLTAEGEVVVMRHGKPIARVVPMGVTRRRPGPVAAESLGMDVVRFGG